MRIAFISLFLALHSLAAPSLPEHLLQNQHPLGLDNDNNMDTTSSIDVDVSNLTSEDDLLGVIKASPLLSLHRSLSTIQSISNDERDLGLWLTSYLQKSGFRVEIHPVPRDWEPENDDTSPSGSPQSRSRSRFNLYAYPINLSIPPEIILTSHIDTVPPYIPYSVHPPTTPSNEAGTTAKSNFSREEIVIAGRGTVDAKASVAAQITAAKSALDTNLHLPLALLFVVSEETGGRGMQFFSNNTTLNPTPPTYHTVIFGEPTALALVSGHKGLLLFTVTATGHAAHSGYPWLGRSAVSDLLPVLSSLDNIGNVHAGLPVSPLLGKSTCNIGVINAGVATNVVPARAVAEVSVRLAAGSLDGARNIISRAVAKAAPRGANVTVAFDDGIGYGPVHVDTDVEGFEVMAVNYGTDVPNLDIHGEDAKTRVKRYLYGPGNIFVAHGDAEALTVRDLETAVDGYVKLIKAASVQRNGKAEKEL